MAEERQRGGDAGRAGHAPEDSDEKGEGAAAEPGVADAAAGSIVAPDTAPDGVNDVAPADLEEPRLIDAELVEAPLDPEPAIEPAPDASPLHPRPSLLRRLSGTSQARGREIWALSLPIMMSQVLVSTVGLIDIAMVGRLGAAEVAAVGYATQLHFMSQSALFAVGFACVALMARAIGAGNPARARAALAASLAVALTTASAVAAIILFAPHAVLAWLNAEPSVAELTIPYMRMLFASSLLLAVALTLEHGLRANRDTRTPMRIAVAVTLVKTLLNSVLIFGVLGAPRLGIVGAGIATIVSQVVAVAAFVWVIRRQPAGGPVALGIADFGPGRRYLREVVRVAIPGVGERVVLNLALLDYFALLGGYGTVAIAAYTVGVRILAFSWIPGTGFGAATATLVGQQLGAGDPDGAERTGWLAARIAFVTAIVLGLAGALAREPLARLFTTDAATVEMLGPFMLMLALAQPMMQVHFTLGGAHRGAGDTWTPLLAATMGNWGFRVPVATLASALSAPLIWVWLALVLDHAARMIFLGIAFARGGWKRRGPR
ncbi:MAG TPA: MATE family efflux transporter [Candidatus Limnocylindrales bacterium]|nr:MATE family efflux transporter [Candidatus Limnocylindrales bacterium]